MLKIIAPVDFSDTSATALKYACQLADRTGLDLKVVHIHDGYGNSDRLVVKKGNPEARAEAMRQMEQFVRFNADPVSFTATAGDHPDERPFIETEEFVGSPTPVLRKLSEDPTTALIVMGGVGSGAVSRVTPLFGSVASSVTMNAACPVLLVPQGADVPDIKVASIAFDTVRDLEEVSDGCRFLREGLEPTMRFVHVRDKNVQREEDKETALLETVLDTTFPGYPVELDLLPPGEVATRLLEYTLESSVDLLILGHRQRGLFKRLFVGSEILPVLEESGTPLLVVPISDQ